MTARQLIEQLSQYQVVLIAVFAAPPLLSLLLRMAHGRDNGAASPWRYFYSVLIYWVCVPGVLAATLVAYGLFFTRQNMLDVNLLVYGLPLLSMVVTLLLISRNVAFKEIPGFGRLSGLITMIAMVGVVILAISKTSIWIFFGGSIAMLFLLAAGVFALIKWGAYMAFRGKDQPKKQRPKFPGLS